MQNIVSLINETYPGTFIHSIYLDEDPSKDRNAAIFGRVVEQIDFVCEQLASIPALHSGFDAMGFSQGGQFMRGFVERCNHPPVRNLITWGAQHNGIADLPACSDGDWLCNVAHGLLKRNLWGSYVREQVVQAQYYRDPEDLERYLELSAWLADINNEREEKNETYSYHLSSLEKFVMIKFDDEKTVVPADSSVPPSPHRLLT
jgi:palmitoyl-protein thioesterase